MFERARRMGLVLAALLAVTGCDTIQGLIPGGDEETEETVEAEAAPTEATAEAAAPAEGESPAAPEGEDAPEEGVEPPPAEAEVAEAEVAEAEPAEAAPAEAPVEEADTAPGEELTPTEAHARPGPSRPEARRPPPREEGETPEAPAVRPGARQAQVQGAVRSAARECFSRTQASGRVSVRVQVGGDGRVFRGLVTQNDTGDQEVARCISGALVGRRFDAPAPAGEDTYEVDFSG